MKIFGILLFTFVVFLNSIEVSLQAGESSDESKLPYREIKTKYLSPPNSRGMAELEIANLSRGHHIMLPNGNIYESTGTGRIHITYHVPSDSAKIEQEGSGYLTLHPLHSPPRPSHPGPSVTIVKFHGDRP